MDVRCSRAMWIARAIACPFGGAQSHTEGPPRSGPLLRSQTSPGGGVASYAGHYDDEYVKTRQGWRFKSRTATTGQEQTANLTVEDVVAIRRLAGTDLGLFDDVYVAGPDGVRRFRTSGVALGLSAEGVTGRALLKNGGGYYEDVYPARRLAFQVARLRGSRGGRRERSARTAMTCQPGPRPGVHQEM
jgi:hypothetical protein